jgi:hypothetical protein
MTHLHCRALAARHEAEESSSSSVPRRLVRTSSGPGPARAGRVRRAASRGCASRRCRRRRRPVRTSGGHAEQRRRQGQARLVAPAQLAQPRIGMTRGTVVDSVRLERSGLDVSALMTGRSSLTQHLPRRPRVVDPTCRRVTPNAVIGDGAGEYRLTVVDHPDRRCGSEVAAAGLLGDLLAVPAYVVMART